MNSILPVAKKYLSLVSIGGLAGVAIAAWISPRLLEWWAAPVVDSKTAFACDAEVRWAADRLVQFELWGGLIVAAIALVAGVLVSRARAARERRAAVAQPPGDIGPAV